MKTTLCQLDYELLSHRWSFGVRMEWNQGNKSVLHKQLSSSALIVSSNSKQRSIFRRLSSRKHHWGWTPYKNQNTLLDLVKDEEMTAHFGIQRCTVYSRKCWLRYIGVRTETVVSMVVSLLKWVVVLPSKWHGDILYVITEWMSKYAQTFTQHEYSYSGYDNSFHKMIENDEKTYCNSSCIHHMKNQMCSTIAWGHKHSKYVTLYLHTHTHGL